MSGGSLDIMKLRAVRGEIEAGLSAGARRGDPLAPLHGMRVLVSRHRGRLVQVRFPRSKRRRIRKKWRKDPAA